MCNLSENIIAIGIEQGIEQGIERGIEQGIKKELLNAIVRMIHAGAAKEQISSFGYTGEELAEAESILCTDI